MVVYLWDIFFYVRLRCEYNSIGKSYCFVDVCFFFCVLYVIDKVFDIILCVLGFLYCIELECYVGF